ncbi:MAG: amidohydrolase [Acidobacteria bacterium RIFCSPLOWO2_02_FULL_67_36]|nr:MAG: amidohydrolase [Acidobacteria bacterium RIFCSPLOWO2_02_FULL_67_36]OFW21153.1 MAG: amidohydrolase [Acidobacteria bacterium RIFCSPLOWO2_12_FULL_66_21]
MAEACDLLLTNATVLTMDDRFTIHPDSAVAVSGDSLVAVGPDAGRWQARETVDCRGRVVMPGLVNAHTHAAMALLRGLADDLRLDVWLMGYMMPVEREFVSPDFVRLGTRLGCAEMIRSGITCFADMYYFEETVAEATAEAGLRALCAQTILRFPSPDSSSFEDGLARARDFIARWRDHPLIVPAPGPHAPYTCTPEILRSAAELAAEFDVPLHIHLSETLAEVEQSRALHGMPVVPWVKKQGLFGAKVLAAHCVHVDDGEMRALKNFGAGVAHNPTSNLKLGAGVAPVVRMLELGLDVGIGTDGAASNNDLDMFEETRLAALLAKGIGGDPTALPARDALAMATRGGARALHMAHLTGSLEAGKRADLIVIDLDRLHNTPAFERDPNAVYAQIVYASKSTDVTDVLCNGRWLMRDRTLLTLNEADLCEEARGYARRIDAFLGSRELSVLQKLVAVGGAIEQESYEVQVKARVPSAAQVLQVIDSEELTVIRGSRYHQFDTYWSFDDPAQGRLRYREDEFLDQGGKVTGARARLTLTGGTREDRFGDVLLHRSRYLAPATHTARFYREYFRPAAERVVEKERQRWLVAYRGVEFYVHLDRLVNPPADGFFVEVKSRTWSRRDARDKAAIITALLALFGARPDDAISDGYVEMIGR